MKKQTVSVPLASKNNNLLNLDRFEQLTGGEYHYIYRENTRILEIYTAQTRIGYLEGACAEAAVEQLRLQNRRSLLVLRGADSANLDNSK